MSYLESAIFVHSNEHSEGMTLAVDNINVVIDPRLRYANVIYDIVNVETGESLYPNITHAFRPALSSLNIATSPLDMVTAARAHAMTKALAHPIKSGGVGKLPLNLGATYTTKDMSWVAAFLSSNGVNGYGFIDAFSYNIRTINEACVVSRTLTSVNLEGSLSYFNVNRALTSRVHTHFLNSQLTLDRIVTMASGWDNVEGEEYRNSLAEPTSEETPEESPEGSGDSNEVSNE